MLRLFNQWQPMSHMGPHYTGACDDQILYWLVSGHKLSLDTKESQRRWQKDWFRLFFEKINVEQGLIEPRVIRIFLLILVRIGINTTGGWK